jgi:DNA ligase D-like protein (predicted 3'-phosphoesterase)
VSLETYHRKRDFGKTKEPAGKVTRPKRRAKPKFVIQLHEATARHYDFRLEDEGVLKSWAVPKGPSTDPREKRLAVPTEDHPMEYRTFEGVIADGEYGAGPVLVWDSGTFRNLSDEPLAQALDRGHAKFWLDGKKLTGGWALNRFRSRPKPMWLLVKLKDEHAGSGAEHDDASVKTGRTLEEVSHARRGHASR